MKKKLITISLFVAFVAHAESLEEKKYWKDQMDYLNRSIDAASEACGVKFTFAWVDKAKLRSSAEKAGHSPYGICASVVDEVFSLCREGDDEKAAVKAGIKGFKCGFANPRKLDLKGGIVTYMGNNDQSNFSQWAKPILEKNL